MLFVGHRVKSYKLQMTFQNGPWAVTVVRKPFLLSDAAVLMSHTVLEELSIWFCLEDRIFDVQTDYSRILLSSFFHLIPLVSHSSHYKPYLI